MVKLLIVVYMNQYITGLKECPHKESGPHNNTKVTLFTQEAQKCFVENF